MIPEIKEQFTEEILNEAIKRYDINAESIRSMGGFESFVYEYQKNNTSYILKITHTIRRTMNYILGEIEWLNFLSSKGLAVSKAIPSMLGNDVEEIQSDRGSFLVISYEKAHGSEVTKEVWNDSLYEKWGEFMGKIHSATKDYLLSSEMYKRQEWEQEEQLRADKYLEPDDVMINILNQRMNKLMSLPKTRDTYGLVHADFHHRNFYVFEEDIYLFDGDDCSYTYYINDIGITLYYALCYPPKKFENRAEYCKTFFRCFMKGYLKENTMTEDEITYLQDFIKLRHTLLYIIYHQTNDVTQMDEQTKRELKQHQCEISSDEPMIPIDFVDEFRQIKL